MYKCKADKKSSISKTILTVEELISNFNESASFVSQLLGLIYSKTERVKLAIEYYNKSLKINPFLWSSFEKLTQLGIKPDSSKIFDINNVDFNMCHGFNPLVNLWNTTDKLNENLSSHHKQHANFSNNQNFNSINSTLVTDKNLASLTNSPGLINMKELNQPYDIRLPFAFIKSTPELNSIDIISPLTTNSNVPGKISRAPIKKPHTRRGQQQSTIGLHNLPSRNLTSKLQLANTVNTQQPIDNANTLYSTSSTPNQNSTIQSLRRSSRLFNSSSSVKENNTKTARNMNQENSTSKKTLQTSCTKTPTKRIKMSNSNNSSTSIHKTSTQQDAEFTDFTNQLQQQQQKTVDRNLLQSTNHQQSISEDLKQTGLKMQRSSAEGLLNLLRELGKAALAIGQFKCEQAINILQKLPRKHYSSAYVLTSIGRAYFELGKYEEAVKYFKEVNTNEPHQLKGMEYYSTALWHLQQEVKLSTLAQELIEYDKNAPQTWCVAGNCFSLQKEHENAIKFLQRAIQVDTDFAYAYTLLGHEYVLTEEMDHAIACFRNAIRIDFRHYNAFYGIGMIYYKQEKFQMAEIHYRKALKISANPVLLCHLAVVQHALKKSDLALQTLNKAIEMDSNNALCKFHRASIKFSMDDYKSALAELDELKQIVPEESLVYFLIGKVSDFSIFFFKISILIIFYTFFSKRIQQVYKKLGNTHLALMNFSWAVELDPKGANNQIKEVIDKQYPNDDDDQISDPAIRNDSTNSTDNNSDNSLIRPNLSMSSSSSMDDEDS